MEGAAGAGLGVDRFGHGEGMAPFQDGIRPHASFPRLDKLTLIAGRCLQLCRIYSGMDVSSELDPHVCLGSKADAPLDRPNVRFVPTSGRSRFAVGRDVVPCLQLEVRCSNCREFVRRSAGFEGVSAGGEGLSTENSLDFPGDHGISARETRSLQPSSTAT